MIFRVISKIFNVFQRKKLGTTPPTIYEEKIKEVEIHSIWDYLKFQEHTQAFHTVNVIGFDEWVTMEEIKRRILELFRIGYKNDRSLYPYIKTLVDCGLLEFTSAGGKRKWKKKDLLIQIEKKKKEEKKEDKTPEKEKIEAKTSS